MFNSKKIKKLNIILATESKTRIDLFKSLGFIPKKTEAANICEDKLRNETKLNYVKRLALSKAVLVQSKNPDLACLAFDTIVYRKNKILTKPENANDAKEQIEFLNGNSHRVLTAVALLVPKEKQILQFVRTEETRVKFAKIDKKDISDYIESCEWQGKSGSYSMYSYGSLFIKSINGLSDNVAGLPIRTTLNLLRGNNLISSN